MDKKFTKIATGNKTLPAPPTNAEVSITGKTMLSPKSRSKNEEAIQDLRERIPDIESIFDLHSRIGNGTFSTVLLATLKKDRNLDESLRKKFAIKHHIPTSHPDRIIKELKCMVEIGGVDNVVGINCTIRNNESVAFVMPYMPHDRFHDFFSKMDTEEVQCYLKNLLIALRRVHQFNVIHRDVKPSNFLYNRRTKQFLLVDFGLAQKVPRPSTVAAGNNNKLNCDTKRLREDDLTNKTIDSSKADGDAKRMRCNSTFKMPLKQINEISNHPRDNQVTSQSPQVQPPQLTCRQSGGKSSIIGATFNRLQQQQQQKVRNPIVDTNKNNSLHHNDGDDDNGDNNNSTAINIANTTVTALQSPLPDAVVHPPINSNKQLSNKYNTNRNANNNQRTAAKCACFGKPQVCNMCLVKKEIHASRAGTPGYRPPEVLLKYPDQTTAVDIWAVGVIFLSILSSVYPFFKAPNDYIALAEMVTIFGDRAIRKTAYALDRLVTLSQKTKPLDLRKLCVRFRNRAKFSSPELLEKYKKADGTCEICKNCDQYFFNCLCAETAYAIEPMCSDDPFPKSAYDLLYKLLEVNPHKRITAEEALTHQFFNS